MIMKLDHVAFSCSRAELPTILERRFASYKQVFYEKDLPNIVAKRMFLDDENVSSHDIMLLRGGTPVEVTAYDKVMGTAKYDMDGETIIAYTGNLVESAGFYCSIGFKQLAGDDFYVHTLMDSVPFKMRLVPKERHGKCKLDNRGFCCIALITNNVEKEKKRLEAKSVMTTDIGSLTVNGKLLNIFFAYNSFGDVMEFIQPYNRRNDL